MPAVLPAGRLLARETAAGDVEARAAHVEAGVPAAAGGVGPHAGVLRGDDALSTQPAGGALRRAAGERAGVRGGGQRAVRQLRAAASCGESSNKPARESSNKPARESSNKPARESSAEPARESSAEPAKPAKPAKPSHESGRKQQSEKCFQQSEKPISKHQSQPIVEKELQNSSLLCLSQTQQKSMDASRSTSTPPLPQVRVTLCRFRRTSSDRKLAYRSWFIVRCCSRIVFKKEVCSFDLCLTRPSRPHRGCATSIAKSVPST